MVAVTGERDGRPGFTFSDLAQRLIPGIVLDAYPDRPILAARALEIAEDMAPTPRFVDKRSRPQQQRVMRLVPMPPPRRTPPQH